MSDDDLLEAAIALIESDDAKTRGWWPRAAALLTRAAIEQRLAVVLSARGLDPREASKKLQLLVLAEVMPDQVADEVRWAWEGLSQAVHHHQYELAPTADELRGWAAAAGRIVDIG